jgi:hypothetical protein
MPINIPALITNTGNETGIFLQGGSAPAGVSTLNGLSGVVNVGSSASVASSVSGQNVLLSTAGLPQAPSSLTTAGTVSAGTFVGGGLGLTLPTTSTGRATVAAAPPSGTQTVNIVIGNTRVQAGASGFALGPTIPINFETAFSGNPTVYVQTYELATVLSETIWVDPLTITTSSATINGTPAQFFAWLAIGPA